jgi:hypothetical protein
MLKSAFHFLEDRFDGHFRLRFGDSGFADDFVDDVELDQKPSSNFP